MAIELGKLATQTRELWQRLPARRRWLIGGASVATVALVAALALRSPDERFTVLFAGLAAEDAGQVVQQLQKSNDPYRLSNGGTTIEVPTARVYDLRLSLATAGLPRGGGVGFEVFDKQTFGTSSFVEQMNYRRALQGELEKTIRSLEAVERARVHIAMRERSLFSAEDEPPAASVVLQLRPGRTLAGAQVKGVVHLVAASIEGLRPDRVTLVDESGAILWSGDESAVGRDEQRDLERTLTRRVLDLVERFVGAGHAAVAVTTELDQTKIDRTSDLYDKDKIALRSEARVEEGLAGGGTVGGVAGARGNLPGAAQPVAGPVDAAGHTRLSETRNFEVNRVQEHTISPVGRVKRLHVAVLVDGVNGAPRSAAEIGHIAALAGAAAGIDAARGDRIEVHSVPFSARAGDEGADAARSSAWRLPVLLAGLGVAVVLGLVAFAVLRARSRRRAGVAMIEARPLPSLPASVADLEATLAGTSPAPALATRSARDRGLEAVRADAARAARVLSAWLDDGSVPDRASTP